MQVIEGGSSPGHQPPNTMWAERRKRRHPIELCCQQLLHSIFKDNIYIFNYSYLEVLILITCSLK